jgi:histone H2B
MSDTVVKEKKGGKKGEKRHRKRHYNNFRSHIYKVLKQVHPDRGITKKAMESVNSMSLSMFEDILDEAVRCMKVNKRQTLSTREIQSAIRLVLVGELAKHGVSEGTKAVTKYNSSSASESETKKD